MTPVPCAAHQGISAPAHVAADHREGRLQRRDVPDRLAALEEGHVEVRDARPADLALVHEAQHLAPRVLDRRPRLVGPVELVEVDRLDAEPAQRGLALLAHARRPRVARGGGHAVLVVPAQAALGEHEGPLGGGDPGEGPADDLLGVAVAVDRRGVDPVDALRDRVADRGDRLRVVLRAPGEGPAAAARGPGAEADGRDLGAGRAEPAGGESDGHGPRRPRPRAPPSAGRGRPAGS